MKKLLKILMVLSSFSTFSSDTLDWVVFDLKKWEIGGFTIAPTVAPTEEISCFAGQGYVYPGTCYAMVTTSTAELIISTVLLKELQAAQVDAVSYHQGDEPTLQLENAVRSLQKAFEAKNKHIDFDEAAFEIANARL